MPSQIELLEKQINRLVGLHGEGDPYVTQLRRQLSSMKSRQQQMSNEEPYRDNPVGERYVMGTVTHEDDDQDPSEIPKE